MARTTIVPLELLLVDLTFREGDEGGDNTGENKGGDEGNKGDDGGDDDEDEDILTDSKGRKHSVAALKSALASERKRAEKLEKEDKARQKAADDAALKEQGEIAQLKAIAEKAAEKAERLAKAYYKSAVDTAIEREAGKQKFIDTSDALGGVDRSLIEAEQDEDNPDKVVVDPASVVKAVKALAQAKKHLIKSGTEDGNPTGSSFGGNGDTKNRKISREQELATLYPGL